jgi:hypothetical protein
MSSRVFPDNKLDDSAEAERKAAGTLFDFGCAETKEAANRGGLWQVT